MRLMHRAMQALLAVLFLSLCGTALAKDRELLENMVDVEQAYIPALYLTSVNSPDAAQAMAIYAEEWYEFDKEYWDYRKSEKNWIAYFTEVRLIVAEAQELVDAGQLVAAHDVLEEVRILMRELRMRNGYPKFTPDLLTAFHSIMGQIIAVVNTTIDAAAIDTLNDLYKQASRAWAKVERNPIDMHLWDLSKEQVLQYDLFVVAERTALDAFKAALDSGDPVAIKTTAMGLKPAQAQAYLLLGDFESIE